MPQIIERILDKNADVTVKFSEADNHSAQSHPFAARARLSMQNFQNVRLVFLDLLVVSEYCASQFDRAGISPDTVATATSLEMVRSLVGRGVVCSLVHVAVANDLIYAGDRVVAVPLDPQVEPFKIVFGHLSGNPRRLVQVFIEELRSYFEGKGADVDFSSENRICTRSECFLRWAVQRHRIPSANGKIGPLLQRARSAVFASFSRAVRRLGPFQVFSAAHRASGRRGRDLCCR